LSVYEVASYYDPLSQITRIFVSSSREAKTPRQCVDKKGDDEKAT